MTEFTGPRETPPAPVHDLTTLYVLDIITIAMLAGLIFAVVWATRQIVPLVVNAAPVCTP